MSDLWLFALGALALAGGGGGSGRRKKDDAPPAPDPVPQPPEECVDPWESDAPREYGALVPWPFESVLPADVDEWDLSTSLPPSAFTVDDQAVVIEASQRLADGKLRTLVPGMEKLSELRKKLGPTNPLRMGALHLFHEVFRGRNLRNGNALFIPGVPCTSDEKELVSMLDKWVALTMSGPGLYDTGQLQT